ncbi:MAG: Gfo/Idh/MocA family oxidoreductase [Planctomycetes bacterium]|nr:Gfo/Idh/MocA family oxidoreductase [Planctomycetota bacterium]
MPSRISRRRFLESTTAGAVSLGAFSSLPAEEKKTAPSERLRVGVIGVAGKGESNWMPIAAAGAEIVAGCDVDESRTAKFRTAYPKVPFFADFRKLLDAKGLDAVVVSTPDHMHALPTLMALRAGLHVYCEKPLTHSVAEARLIAETANKMKRVTQMGTQIHAGTNYRRVVELIQSNAIGKVSEVHVWVPTTYNGTQKKADQGEVPKTLNWDLWLGTALDRPYHKDYVPFWWRRYWAFGGGALNDMACHYMDLPFWALKLRHPTHVSAEGTPPTVETAAEWMTATYDFPGVKVKWYDGGKVPKPIEDGTAPKWRAGILFVGDKGMLISDYSKYQLLPEKQFVGFKPPEPFIADSVGHHKEWVDACKTGSPTTCNFDYSGALTECVELGTVAYRSGKSFDWDAAKLKPSAPEAVPFVSKEYRKGWEVA